MGWGSKYLATCRHCTWTADGTRSVAITAANLHTVQTDHHVECEAVA